MSVPLRLHDLDEIDRLLQCRLSEGNCIYRGYTLLHQTQQSRDMPTFNGDIIRQFERRYDAVRQGRKSLVICWRPVAETMPGKPKYVWSERDEARSGN